jgi:hypothetical protein
VELAKKPSAISHTEYGNTSGNGVGVDTPIKAKSGSKNVTSTPLKAISGHLPVRANAVGKRQH